MATATVASDEILENSHLDQVSEIISSAVKWAALGAVVPLPIVDMFAIGAVQLQMVRRLSKVYGYDESDKTLQALITALLGTMAPVYLNSALLGSSLKLAGPFGTTGSLMASAGISVFAAASTYAIGKIFVRHFEKGGTVKNFNVDDVKEDLKQEFDSAKKK